MKKLYTKATIEKKTANDFVAIASTGVEDRHGEIVSVEGWDLKAFKSNPVLLWAHDHSQPAIGTANKVWVEGTGKRAKLMIEGVINEATELAKAVKQLVQDGVIRTMSVGFRPIEMEEDTFTSQELLEVSFVNVPANQQALITAYKSLHKAGFKDKTIDELGIPSEIIKQLGDLTERVSELERVKEEQNSASEGRHPLKQAEKRQVYVKVIEKAATKLVTQRRSREVLVIKRAIDKLSVMNKEEING